MGGEKDCVFQEAEENGENEAYIEIKKLPRRYSIRLKHSLKL